MPGHSISGLTDIIIIRTGGRLVVPDASLGQLGFAFEFPLPVFQSCQSRKAHQIFSGSSDAEKSVATII